MKNICPFLAACWFQRKDTREYNVYQKDIEKDVRMNKSYWVHVDFASAPLTWSYQNCSQKNVAFNPKEDAVFYPLIQSSKFEC